MRKGTLFVIAGVLLIVAGAVLQYMNIAWAPVATALVGTLLLMNVSKAEGAKWQSLLVIIGCALVGYTITPGQFVIPLSLALAGFMMTFRSFVYEQLGLTRFFGLEIVLFCLSIATYVFANIYGNLGWAGWVLPVPIVLMESYIMFGWIFDITHIKRFSIGQYKAKTGAKAPDFSLPDEEGKTVTLSAYKGRCVLLIFVRGDWCPTCHIMLRTYEKYKDTFAQKNVILMAIGPDPIGVNKKMVLNMGLDYRLLSDVKRTAAKAYGMMFQPNNILSKYDDDGIPLPASFLVDSQGVIAYTSNPRVPGQILKPDAIFPVLEKLQ